MTPHIEHPRARRSDPHTSHDAAGSLPKFTWSQHERIYMTLTFLGDLGAEQIAEHLVNHVDIDAYQVRKRLPELQRVGLACPTDKTRTTKTGRYERIWTAKKP